jgi:hypothetical protein
MSEHMALMTGDHIPTNAGGKPYNAEQLIKTSRSEPSKN